jgi:alpha-ribazole phosphatase/probable phosphoglycerate mutase
MREAVADRCPWQCIVSSPLIRCQAFAEELAQRHDRELVIDDRLKEIGFGDWEGRTAAELQAEQDIVLHHFWADPLRHRPPGAESMHDFEARVVGAWEQILRDHRGRHVLIVGHAGMMRMIIRHVLGMPLAHVFRIQVANAAISRIQVDHFEDLELPRLVFHDGRLA